MTFPYPPNNLRQSPLERSASSSSRNLFASSWSAITLSCSLGCMPSSIAEQKEGWTSLAWKVNGCAVVLAIVNTRA